MKPEQHPSARLVRESIVLHNFITTGRSQSIIVEGIVASTYGQFCSPSHDISKSLHLLWGSRLIVELFAMHPTWPNVTLCANDPFLQLLKSPDFAKWCLAHGDELIHHSATFVSQVVGHRERFPALQAKYLATRPEGETSALTLPVLRTASVPATHVSFDEP